MALTSVSNEKRANKAEEGGRGENSREGNALGSDEHGGDASKLELGS
jgi:hypothetical protein